MLPPLLHAVSRNYMFSTTQCFSIDVLVSIENIYTCFFSWEYIHLGRIFGVPLFWKQIFLNNIFPFHVLLSEKNVSMAFPLLRKNIQKQLIFFICLFIGSKSVPWKKLRSKYVIFGKHYFLCLFVGSNHNLPKQLPTKKNLPKKLA